MKLSREEYERQRAARPDIFPAIEAYDSRHRPCPVHEELQGESAKRDLHETKVRQMDAGVQRQFRVRVTLRVSDNRKRDADGALSTILDCLVAAARRLSEGDRGGADQSRAC